MMVRRFNHPVEPVTCVQVTGLNKPKPKPKLYRTTQARKSV